MRPQHLYLSPHLDDAALSVGATIASQTGRHEPVLVLTVFAGDPPENERLGAHARHLHSQWGLGEAPVARRRCEDRRAMEILAAGWLHLALPDGIYRCVPSRSEPCYDSEAQLFGPLHPEERALPAHIAKFVAGRFSSERLIVYAPLGIGRHVDHRLCRQAGRLLAADGWSVLFYADFPYAVSAGEAATGPACADVERKIEAALAYTSQRAMLFGPDRDPGPRLRAHVERLESAGC